MTSPATPPVEASVSELSDAYTLELWNVFYRRAEEFSSIEVRPPAPHDYFDRLLLAAIQRVVLHDRRTQRRRSA